MTKTFSWSERRLLQICGQVNNYARPETGFQRQFAAERRDAFAHALNAEAGLLLRADAAAVIVHLEVEPRVTLAEQNRDFAGVGVFADVVEQLLEKVGEELRALVEPD